MPRPARPLAALTGTLACTLAALLAACGGDGDKITGTDGSSARLGSFSGNVSGAVSLGIQGVALYGQITEPADERGFGIAMGSLAADSTFDNLVVLYREKPDVPGAGTYALYNAESDDDPPADAFSLVSVLHAAGQQPTLCFATSGTLTVSSAGGGRVKGSYTAQATCVATADAQHAVTATLTGSFDAVEGSKYVHVPNSVRLAHGAAVTMRARR